MCLSVAAILGHFINFWTWQHQNASILRDFLNFWTWQRQKQNNSARLPQCSKLTTSKTKQFCETWFKTGKLSAELTASYQCVFAIFPLHLSEVLHLPRKSDARSYEVLHLSRKIISANLKIWCSKMQPFSGNQRPDLLTALMNMSLVLRLPRKISENASLQILLKCPTPAIVFGHATKPSRFAHLWQGEQSLAPATRNHIWTSKSAPNPLIFLHFWLRNVLRATTACTFSTSQLPKVVRTWCVLYILTSKCASRHNGVHFFDIATSKSAPNVKCSYLFHWQMRFAPQRRALFRQRNS